MTPKAVAQIERLRRALADGDTLLTGPRSSVHSL